MALTKARVREILSESGIATEHLSGAVESIMDGHTASINALREERDSYKSDAERLLAVQKELNDMKAAEAAAKSAGRDYDALKQEYDTYKAEQEAKEAKAAKESALAELLKDMNLSEKGTALAMKYTDMNTVELNDKGKISNATALRKSISEDWGDYIQQETTKGADTPTPPTGVAPTAGMTREQIFAIKDDAEMVRAIEANPAVFGLA